MIRPALKISRGLILVLLSISAYAQNQYPEAKKFVAAGDVFGTRSFIENKGQFENPVNSGEKVLFLYHDGPEIFYFTANGVIYELFEPDPIEKEEEDEEEERRREALPPPVPVTHYVQ